MSDNIDRTETDIDAELAASEARWDRIEEAFARHEKVVEYVIQLEGQVADRDATIERQRTSLDRAYAMLIVVGVLTLVTLLTTVLA